MDQDSNLVVAQSLPTLKKMLDHSRKRGTLAQRCPTLPAIIAIVGRFQDPSSRNGLKAILNRAGGLGDKLSESIDSLDTLSANLTLGDGAIAGMHLTFSDHDHAARMKRSVTSLVKMAQTMAKNYVDEFVDKGDIRGQLLRLVGFVVPTTFPIRQMSHANSVCGSKGDLMRSLKNCSDTSK